MAERFSSLIAGTAFLCFWLGYNAAKFANGISIQLDMTDGLTLISVAVLLFHGLTGRLGRARNRRSARNSVGR
jgi:hypothetical protein